MAGTTGAIVFIVIGALIVLAATSFLILRRVRRYHYEPKLLPGSYLKRKWQAWVPRGSYRKVTSRQGRGRAESNPTDFAPNADAAEAQASITIDDPVDRRTSVRSVMTLPPYSYAPKPTEQILGREGERAGMDVVAEFPETADEEETRRDEEMESLYQIRQARRQEIADREARRQARREARERGDQETLEALHRQSRLRAESPVANAAPSAATLLAEHQSRGRERRTSAVTYGALGLVRHDGTRIRSDSQDSERGGLLDAAAPMGGAHHVRTISQGSNLPTPSLQHTRNRSASSALSISTGAIDAERNGRQSRGGRSSESSDPNSLTPATTRLTSGTSSNLEGGDLGDSTIPEPLNSAISEPPDYDNLEWGDAPAYSSPIRGPGEGPHATALERQVVQRMLATNANRQSIGSITSIADPAAVNRRSVASTFSTVNGGGNNRRSVARSLNNDADAGSTDAVDNVRSDDNRPPMKTSRSWGVNRIPTLAPQLPQLQRLPTINVHDRAEPIPSTSPTDARGSQTA